MLTFEIVNSGKGIQILCDDQGMAVLVDALKRIRPTGGHVHLRTRANGGHELDEITPWGNKAIGEVIVTWAGD